MSSRPPLSGCSIRDHLSFWHAVQFYQDQDFLVRRLRDLVQSAWRAGSVAMVIATNAHHEALEKSIRNAGEEGEQQWNQAYIHLDAAETLGQCMVRGVPDMMRLRERLAEAMTTAGASKSKRPRPFIYGEIVGLLSLQGKFETAMAVERVWEGLAKRREFSLLCGYPIETFDSPAADSFFVRTCALHSTVIAPDAYPSFESEKRLLRAAAEFGRSKSVQ